MGLLGNSSEEKELILWRKWVKQNKMKSQTPQRITSISLSNSEDWIMIKTEEALALLNAESKMGKEFWESLKEFGGQGKPLVIYPASGKLGFDLDFSDENPVWYEWDEDVLLITNKQTKKKASLTSKINWKEATSFATSDVTSTKKLSKESTGKEQQAIAQSSNITGKQPRSKKDKSSGMNSSNLNGLERNIPHTVTTPISVSSDLGMLKDTAGGGGLEQPWEEE